ncbi:MAG: hypothetical protein SO386_04780 [Eubacteriales bacterium]|nr:hypothetical protein [Eubacteriales bacterium]
MTKEEFIKKAKSFGYTDEQIKKAIDGMLELKNDYHIDVDYDGINLHEQNRREKTEDKFTWNGGDVFIYTPKNLLPKEERAKK